MKSDTLDQLRSLAESLELNIMSEVSAFMFQHHACRAGRKWAEENCQTMSEVFDKCHRSNWLLWVLRKDGSWTRQEILRVAIACAEHVLPIFEKRRPDDNRPRRAIEAAKAVLENDTPENRAYAADAADAAYATADAVYATDAADYAYAAAYAAAAAVYATDAVYAVYAAEAAADADADADADAERQWQADEIRKIVKNPFQKGEQCLIT